MRQTHLLLTAMCAVVCGCAGLGTDALNGSTHWIALFDGESLNGWTATGNPDAWSVHHGEIVVANAGDGGWLRSERMYRDFELELDFNVPENGNSGVGLRATSHGDPAFSGFEVQILDTHAQEPGLRNCGAVYEAIAPRSMAVNPPGQWNSYRIRLVGDSLDVWLNGTSIHRNQRLDDRGFFRSPDQPLPLRDRATTGYIALQDHGDPVRFRNLRIRDLSPDPEPPGMQPLIGESIPDEWFVTGKASWEIEDGAIVGRDGPGHLFTHQTARDFELRCLVKVNARGNSGIYFRATPRPGNRDDWPVGYEAQVDNHDPRNFTGCLYDKAWARTLHTRDSAWFDYRIVARGDHLRTFINGKPMVDARLTDFQEGRFALQGHHPGNVIMYRDIRVLDLPVQGHPD